MDVLVLRLRRSRDNLSAVVEIQHHSGSTTYLGTLDWLGLKEVEWLILANTSESTTPFIVEVTDE